MTKFPGPCNCDPVGPGFSVSPFFLNIAWLFAGLGENDQLYLFIFYYFPQPSSTLIANTRKNKHTPADRASMKPMLLDPRLVLCF